MNPRMTHRHHDMLQRLAKTRALVRWWESGDCYRYGRLVYVPSRRKVERGLPAKATLQSGAFVYVDPCAIEPHTVADDLPIKREFGGLSCIAATSEHLPGDIHRQIRGSSPSAPQEFSTTVDAETRT